MLILVPISITGDPFPRIWDVHITSVTIIFNIPNKFDINDLKLIWWPWFEYSIFFSKKIKILLPTFQTFDRITMEIRNEKKKNNAKQRLDLA